MPLKLRRPHTIDEVIDDLEIEAHHESFIFPEDSNQIVTFSAGGADNTFGNWVEIVDNVPNTFSSKITQDTHISSVMVEEANTPEKIYVVEISYGASNIVVARHRFGSGTRFLDVVDQIRYRPLTIPTGETVYYKMKCETGGATCKVSIRYHYH